MPGGFGSWYLRVGRLCPPRLCVTEREKVHAAARGSSSSVHAGFWTVRKLSSAQRRKALL